ncbi:hypothetical protein PA99_4398 [Pseudomonas aeruginosa PA99]|nr:hypothetical protein PA99_4398 [Pseudomonas aeruginosa PA99]
MLVAVAHAQPSPSGLWQNIDDQTGRPRAEIRITDNGGVLSARIERSLAPDPSKESTHCGKCVDDRKNQPIIGMEIVRGSRRSADSEWWEGGTILDPDNGKTYTLRLRAGDDGKTLQLRGYIGPFYRTQTWERVN